MKEETEAQEVIKPSRVIKSHEEPIEMAELEIKVVWYSLNSAGNKYDHEHRLACIYVVFTVGQILCKHFLITPLNSPEKSY